MTHDETVVNIQKGIFLADPEAKNFLRNAGSSLVVLSRLALAVDDAAQPNGHPAAHKMVLTNHPEITQYSWNP